MRLVSVFELRDCVIKPNKINDFSVKRPNIIFILTDQQRFDTIHSHGYEWMETPNLDRLSSQGFNFHKAYCPAATCTPSRAAIFTGMFAHNSGTYSFQNWGHQRTFVNDLNEVGYWCSSVGKMHFEPRDVSGGFHERVVVENPSGTTKWGGNGDDAWGKYLSFHNRKRENMRHLTDPDWLKKYQGIVWDDDEHLHSDAFVTNSAIGWMRNHSITRDDPEQPWFLEVGLLGPHEPYSPPQRWLDRYMRRKDLPAPIAWDDDLSTKPAQHKAQQDFFANCEAESRIQMAQASPDDIHRMRAHYYASVSYLDELIGKLLTEAETLGMLDNTWIVFSSDHGDALGDHRLSYKWLMYDSMTRVPLILCPPVSPQKPEHFQSPVSLMDLAPTLLDIAGLSPPPYFDGHSLLPLMEGAAKEDSLPDAVYCEDNYLLMMRDREGFKIVVYLDGSPGELYDLTDDPHEEKNLWLSDELSPKRTEMELKVLRWLARSCYKNAAYKCNPDNRTGGFPGYRWPDNSGHLALIGPGLIEKLPY